MDQLDNIKLSVKKGTCCNKFLKQGEIPDKEWHSSCFYEREILIVLQFVFLHYNKSNFTTC